MIVESGAMKTLRSHLEDRYGEVGRVAKPLWFGVWLVCIALMATPVWKWAFSVAAAVLVAYALVIGQIKCPRCGKRLGVMAQTQPGGRSRIGLPLKDIRCPHCRLMLDEPVSGEP
jgi:DNA-directed RNA polymerase subunit RPC12/RpoP